MGLNAVKGSRTIMKGGFLDSNRTTGAFFRRNDTLRRFTGSGALGRERLLTGMSHADMVGTRMGPGSSVFGGFMGRRRKLADLSMGLTSTGNLTDNLMDVSRGLAPAHAKGVPTPKFRPRIANHVDPRSLFRHEISLHFRHDWWSTWSVFCNWRNGKHYWCCTAAHNIWSKNND